MEQEGQENPRFRWHSMKGGDDSLEQKLPCGHWVQATFDSLCMKDETCEVCIAAKRLEAADRSVGHVG